MDFKFKVTWLIQKSKFKSLVDIGLGMVAHTYNSGCRSKKVLRSEQDSREKERGRDGGREGEKKPGSEGRRNKGRGGEELKGAALFFFLSPLSFSPSLPLFSPPFFLFASLLMKGLFTY